MISLDELKKELTNMRNMAYSPYYKYTVGAVLISKSGKIYTGCNIENVTQGPGMCGERVAFAKAISEGEKDFECIYIMGGPAGQDPVSGTPCGVCRQFMTEFCEPEFKIISVFGKGLEIREYTLKEILPYSFNI